MAHDMSSSDGTSTWNPAFKPDNESSSIAPDSGPLSLDSKAETESSSLPRDTSWMSENAETPADLGVPGDDAAVNADGLSHVNDTNASLVEESSNTAAPAEPVDNDDRSDDHAQCAPRESTEAVGSSFDAHHGPKDPATPHLPDTLDTVESEKREEPIFGATEDTGGIESTVNGDSGEHAFCGEAGDKDDGDDFFSQLKTQTKPIYMSPESESKFDEGVPLLDDDVESPKPTPKENTKEDTKGDNIDQLFEDNGEEASFFSEVQKPDTAQERPDHLTRKTTPQVIDSVGGAQNTSSDASPAVQQPSSLASPDPQVKKASSEEDLAARWQAALSDDDDLLLEEEVDETPASGQPMPQYTHAPDSEGLSSPFETSARTQPSFAPHQPSTSDLLQWVPMQGNTQTDTAPAPSYFAPRPLLSSTTDRAESFAERSKEGYKSPYDLPEGLTKPRKPAATARPVIAAGGTPNSPRSSSIPAPPAATSMPANATAPAAPAAPVLPPKNFYEELPMPPPKPRPAASGRYTPEASSNQYNSPPPPRPQNQPSPSEYTSVPPQGLPQTYGPPPPQQPGQFGSPSMLAPNPPAAPGATGRYSPRPPSSQTGGKPPSSPKYSPAPPSTSAAPRNRYASQPATVPAQGAALPFQPRTSSPLAHHEKISYQPQAPEEPQAQRASVSPPHNLQPRQSFDQGIQGPRPGDTSGPVSAPGTTHTATPPTSRYAPPEYIHEFSQRVAPVSGGTSAPPTVAPQSAPPRRSQTQSPGRLQTIGSDVPSQPAESFQRPASAHAPNSPVKEANPYAPAQVSAHKPAPSQQLQYIPPSEGQQLDQMERWKGAPIVKFGFGGVVTSCFPRHIPRYFAGQAAPMIASTPGEVKINQLHNWLSEAESIVPHPGPLTTKSKKKDLLPWLSSKIAAFENEGFSEAAQLHPESHKRHDEKILLWKIIRVLVENDGTLEGSDSVHATLRSVIFPDFQAPEAGQASAGVQSRSDAATDVRSVEDLRNNLIIGDREKAVWNAADNRQWGHAMILASTLDKSVWKQVVQEFVRQEVRSATGNTESLAALYEIFAGNVEESIDELVPPSARAGLQMISRVDGSGPAKNALDGLDKWRDTLGLLLSNRSPEDFRALLSLGQLLSSYGRTEAAHICSIFSRVPAFGGPDDPQANIVLLGADHFRFPTTFFNDDDSILLTEAYEYALSVLASSPTAVLPHLLGFKLLHAHFLADRGRKSEALQYCDSVAAALRSTTRPSGYHHQRLFSEVNDLSARLRQTTSDGGSSWIPRPSLEKVSGSMWSRFNSFVAGDDSDAGSTGSGKAGEADVGPFANVAGTPTVSRSPSVTDSYVPYGGAQSIPTTVPSRYHPANQYAPNASPEQPRGRSSLDSQRSSSHGYAPAQWRDSQDTAAVDSDYHGGPMYGSPSAAGYQPTAPQSTYMPLAPVEEDRPSPSQFQSPYAPMQTPASGVPYQPQMQAPDSFGDPLHEQHPTSAPQTDGAYMPPTGTGPYEPASQQETFMISTPEKKEDSADEATHSRKPFMNDDDDDDDMAARAATIQKQEKARKDREADEAFKKAAEEDGKLSLSPTQYSH